MGDQFQVTQLRIETRRRFCELPLRNERFARSGAPETRAPSGSGRIDCGLGCSSDQRVNPIGWHQTLIDPKLGFKEACPRGYHQQPAG